MPPLNTNPELQPTVISDPVPRTLGASQAVPLFRSLTYSYISLQGMEIPPVPRKPCLQRGGRITVRTILLLFIF